LSDLVDRASVRWSISREKGSLAFDVDLRGLVYPTLCFVARPAGSLNLAAGEVLERKTVSVIANGDLSENSERELGCLATHVTAHEKPTLEYHVKGTISIQQLGPGDAVYCEIVTGRAPIPRAYNEFEVIRSKKCLLDTLYRF
jgi:hypothetical protein